MIDNSYLKYRSYEAGIVVNNNGSIGIQTDRYYFNSGFIIIDLDNINIGYTLIRMWVPKDKETMFQTVIAYMINNDFKLNEEYLKIPKGLQKQIKKEMEIVANIFSSNINPNEQKILRVLDTEKNIYTRKGISPKDMAKFYCLKFMFGKYIRSMNKVR